MSLFGEETDFVAEQVRIYSEIASEHGETLEALANVDTPEAEQQRASLTDQIRSAELSVAQLREQARRDGRELETEGYDLEVFGD